MPSSKPIGVFDSGVGGLTVYRALRALMPHEDFIYFGDTARVPYGTKTPDTVARYSCEIAAALIKDDVKMIVVACNTATAHALPALRARWPQLPFLGVIEPGARAALAATKNNRIVVLATEGTVRAGAYQAAITALVPTAEVEGIGCNLLVALAEEGWTDTPEAHGIVRRYLAGVRLREYDTLVLGCTHFPLLAATIRDEIPPAIALIDSAQTTARAVQEALAAQDLENPSKAAGRDAFLVTDGLERFQAMMERFGGLFEPEAVRRAQL